MDNSIAQSCGFAPRSLGVIETELLWQPRCRFSDQCEKVERSAPSQWIGKERRPIQAPAGSVEFIRPKTMSARNAASRLIDDAEVTHHIRPDSFLETLFRCKIHSSPE